MRPAQERGEGAKKVSRATYLWLSPFLRLLQLGSCVSAFAVIVRAGVSGLTYASFMAFQYLIAATVIAAAWALVMLVLDCISLGRGKLSSAHAPKILRMIGDFVAASLALSAGSAAAGVTTFNDQGGFPYPQTVCQGDTPWDSFCARSKAATAMAFLAFFFFVPSVFLNIARMAVSIAASET